MRRGIGLGFGKRLIQVARDGAPRALVVALNLVGAAERLDGDHGALLGKENPVAILSPQLLPGRVEVIAQIQKDVVEVLARPGSRPGGDGAILDAEGGIGDHRLLRGYVHDAGALAIGAHSLGRVRRKGIRIKALWVVPGARIKKAHRI